MTMFELLSVIAVLPVPSLVQSFCILTTWNAPPGPFDMYSGYDIRYYNGSSEVIFNVAKNRFFLLIVGYNEVAELGPPWDVLVQVGDEGMGGRGKGRYYVEGTVQ